MRTLLLIIAFMAAALPTVSQADGVAERYYSVLLGDHRAGWMVDRQTVADGRITSAAEMHFEIGRGAANVAIVIKTEFVETLDHQPISMRSSQAIASAPVVTAYEFLGETVRVTTTQGTQETTRTAEAPKDGWVTPGRASAMLESAFEHGTPLPAITSLDPTFGLVPVTTTRSAPEETVIEVLGRQIPAYRTESSVSISPGPPSVEYFGLDGRLVRSTSTIGGISITMLATDRDLALSEIDPPEIMRSTFIKPNRAVNDPRNSTRATYVLSVPDGDLGAIPSSPRHRVRSLDAQSARLVVDLAAEPDRTAPDARHLGRSTMIDPTDEAVRGLLDRARPSAQADPAVRAEALRRFVHGYLDQKSLSVGFATASEVARSRVGDCTEHAVLLAALLRADGIPSRTVSGLVYAERFAGANDILGYHMWTQAWIPTQEHGEGWVDLDATLGSGRQSDATHIALDISTLSDDDAVNSMLRLTPMIGRLGVSIESIE